MLRLWLLSVAGVFSAIFIYILWLSLINAPFIVYEPNSVIALSEIFILAAVIITSLLTSVKEIKEALQH